VHEIIIAKFMELGLTRNEALAYVTLLSLVPMLAFALSIVRGFGSGSDLNAKIMTFLAPGQESVGEWVENTVEGANATAVGAVGLVLLVWATIKLLSTIEECFNDIWGVKRGRTWFRKFTDYVSVTVTSPLLLLVALSASTALKSEAGRNWLIGTFSGPIMMVAPVVVTWFAFSAIYIFMPNTRVKVLSALAGGVLAGTAWHVFFWLYTSFQIGVGSQNPIYGAMAAVPVFMVWVYVNWVIVLFGAEVACAADNVDRYWEDRRAEGVSDASREAIALRSMTTLAIAFHRDGKALTADDVAGKLHISSRLVQDGVDTLTNHGLCVQVLDDDRMAYQPARPLGKITPGDIVAAIRNDGQTVTMAGDGKEAALVAEFISKSRDLERSGLQDTTLHDMVVQLVDRQDIES